jgi:hypothetical protein
MIYQPIAIYDRDSIAERCLALIEKHAPRMMLIGGGPLEQSQATRIYHRLTPEKRAEVIELCRDGKLTGTQIARETGSTQSAVFKIALKHGFKLPDGRLPRLMELARR